MSFASLVGEKWLITLVVALPAMTFLFAFDLLLLFKNRDFGFLRTYFLTVEFKASSEDVDTLSFVGADVNVRLKTVIPNRFLLWRMLWAAYKLEPDHLVLDLGRQSHDIAELLRYQLNPLNRSGLTKEAGNRFVPRSFKTVRGELLVCLVYHGGVFKQWLVHEEDLRNAERYLKSKTNRQAQNRNILFTLARDYNESPDRFFPFTLVAG